MADKESQPQNVSHNQSAKLSSSGEDEEGRSGQTMGKSTWPELVGLTAEKKMKEEMPSGTHVHVVPPDWSVTLDLRTERVRIFTDSSGF